MGLFSCFQLIFWPMSQVIAPTKHNFRSMVSVISFLYGAGCMPECVSVLVFLEPGLYEVDKLKKGKKMAHRACLGLSCLTVFRYSRL